MAKLIEDRGFTDVSPIPESQRHIVFSSFRKDLGRVAIKVPKLYGTIDPEVAVNIVKEARN